MQQLFVDKANQLDELLDHLESSATIAFDTEFVSESSYKPDLCLIQVATREMVGVIDPKSVRDLEAFWDCLTRPDKEIIVHAAREEFRFCKRESGKRPGKLFDVQVGAGMVGIGEITDAVPAEVKEQALALKESIASGAYHPFTGPINKQDGSAWLAEGETADDGTLAGMNFYVEGIEGDIPQ